MKISVFFASLAAVLLCCLTAGCQQITPVPVSTAPPVTSSAYAQLNSASPATSTTYTDLPATGSFCYFVQELDGAGVSAASNVACNTTTSALKHIVLNWSVAAAYTCQNPPCTFVVSRAAAILTPVGVPSLQAPTNTAVLQMPEMPADLPKLKLRIATR